MITGNSEKLQKKAERLMPGGVSSPVRAFRAVGGRPLFMQKGTGSHMVDEDENEFIDYCMSWGPLILGHADPAVIRTIRKTAKNGTSFGTSNRYEIQLARLIKERFRSIDLIRFVNSGTEAVMSAVRLARGHTGKDKIIKFDGCYHGHADSMLVAAGSGLATLGSPDSAGVTAGAANDTIVAPFNDLATLEKIMKEQNGTVAAVIAEPVPCNYSLIMPKGDFLKNVRQLCDAYGILLIFDEVITGFRLSKGGAQQYFGVDADITTLGKIIGGGLPVGAYGASRAIMRNVSPLGPVYQAGTLSGNPIAMSAGIATLKKLDKISGYDVLSGRKKLLGDLIHPIVAKYRGKVLFTQLESIFAFNFTDRDSIDSLDHVRACNMEQFARFHGEMLKRGVYLSPSGYEVGFLSTSHTDEDIKKTADAAAESLNAILN